MTYPLPVIARKPFKADEAIQFFNFLDRHSPLQGLRDDGINTPKGTFSP